MVLCMQDDIFVVVADLNATFHNKGEHVFSNGADLLTAVAIDTTCGQRVCDVFTQLLDLYQPGNVCCYYVFGICVILLFVSQEKLYGYHSVISLKSCRTN